MGRQRGRTGHRSARVAVTLLMMVTLVAGVRTGVGSGVAGASTPTRDVVDFPDPSIDTPEGIASGPDGNLWFTNANVDNSSIGRITPSGVVSNYTDPSIDAPFQIAAGPDGNLWFTNCLGNSIGRITPAGVVTHFTGTGIAHPEGITLGPDGNLWFTNFDNNSIGRITVAGVVSNYTGAIDGPQGITPGPDGDLWFTNFTGGSIGRITPAGVVTNHTGTGIVSPEGITTGPDGNLWFTNGGGGGGLGTIGRITPEGVVSNFAGPGTLPGIFRPQGITASPDGNVWFTNEGNNSIGQITPAGVITNFTAAGIDGPQEITQGPDAKLWFTNFGNNQLPSNDSIGRLDPTPPPPPPPDPTGDYTPLTPARILDTRDGTGGHRGPLGPGGSIDVQITGHGGVPASGVSAVVLNATATDPTESSFLTIWPTGVARPEISNLNFVAGQTVPNAVTVEVGSGGQVSVLNLAGDTDVVFDVVGFYANASGPLGSRFHGLPPSRLFDTRDGTGGVPVSPLGRDSTMRFKVTGRGGVPASGVTGVVMNVTVTDPTLASFVTVYPDDVSRPWVSNLNFVAGQTVPNLVIARVPASGTIDFYNLFGTTHLLADVVGYYDQDTSSEAGRLIPLTPQRLLDTRELDEGLGPDSVGQLQIIGFGGVPHGGARSVVLNVTVTNPDAPSYVTVFPDDACSVPLASNLNFVAGQTVPNLVMVPVSTLTGCAQYDGTIDIFNAFGDVDVIVDVFGYFT